LLEVFSLSSRYAAARRGPLLILAAAVLWGTVGVSAQLAYRMDSGLAPLTIGFYRLLVAAAAMIAIQAPDRRTRIVLRMAPRHAWLGAVFAGALLGGYQACYFGAVRGIGVSLATLVTLGLAPVLVTLATSLRGRLPSRRALLGLLVALVGLALLVGLPDDQSDDRRLGLLLAVGSACGYAGLTLLGRWLSVRLGPTHVNLVGFVTGALVLLPFALAGGAIIADVRAALPLVYLGVVPTVVAYSLFFAGVRTVQPGVASTLTLVEPVTASVLAAVLLGDQLSTGALVGGTLLLSAVAVLLR
jgi:DME family drug/metabolite transporter